MKKIFLSMTALLAAGALSAQESQSEGFKKGDAFITGSVGYYYTKSDASKVHNFAIGPSVGYFVNDKIALGAFASYSTVKTTGISYPVVNKTTSYNVGVFGRYYFTPANKFSFFGDLRMSYNNNKLESSESSDTDRTGNGFGVQAGPGINYFISPRFSLNTSLGALSYGTSKTKYGGSDNKTTGFGASLDLSNITFGLTYKL